LHTTQQYLHEETEEGKPVELKRRGFVAHSSGDRLHELVHVRLETARSDVHELAQHGEHGTLGLKGALGAHLLGGSRDDHRHLWDEIGNGIVRINQHENGAMMTLVVLFSSLFLCA
jgi:hypothetical protein